MRFITPFVTTRGLASDLWRDMDQIFNDFSEHNPPVHDEREYAVASEFTEGEQHYMLSLDVPGLKREDIKIELNENTLTVAGERKREREETDAKNIRRIEKFFGQFKRSFTLPSTVEATKIEAHYQDGVLEIYLPKALTAQPRKIEIQAGKTQLTP